MTLCTFVSWKGAKEIDVVHPERVFYVPVEPNLGTILFGENTSHHAIEVVPYIRREINLAVGDVVLFYAVEGMTTGQALRKVLKDAIR